MSWVPSEPLGVSGGSAYILPDGVSAPLGGSSLHPAAAGASFPGGPH